MFLFLLQQAVMEDSSVVSLSKALLSLWWQTDSSGHGTMTSHIGSAFEGVRGRRRGACPRHAQVCAANGSAGGRVRRPRGGPSGLRHRTPSHGDEVSKTVGQPIVNSVCTADSEVFPRGGTGDPRSAASTSIGGKYCSFHLRDTPRQRLLQ